MKLTQEQIRDALKMLHVTPNTAECWVWPRTAAVEALDAYQRVEALLNECESRERELAAEHPKLWKMLTEAKTRLLTTGKLSRALYGEE